MLQNLCFSPPARSGDSFSSKFGMFIQNERPDGSTSLDPVDDPYEGLLGSSFSLSAQLAAGVPLKKIASVPSDSLFGIDVNNFNASKFIDSIPVKSE